MLTVMKNPLYHVKVHRLDQSYSIKIELDRITLIGLKFRKKIFVLGERLVLKRTA